MLVKDIMVYNVITIPADTYVLDAERIMESHKIGRLPVLEKGKLVGLVTKDDLLKASPSSTTPFNQRQLFYLMSKLTVKEIMKTKVVTITPDQTVEKAVALAQKNRVGCLPVVEGDKVIGIVTTNDVFYKILNPLLGIGDKGKRIIVYGASAREDHHKVIEQVIKAGLKVKTFWIPPDPNRNDLVLHLEADDITGLMAELKSLGYEADIREYNA
ncbi:MAG TPA: CBS domain-containing protein [Syntrophorhabdaceae bacterium]|mgnify:FL=1|nr:CBS domain-containing protein [Syntrophorhabdaceae bacterium]HQM80682.1 CBS domain-containing protein [Syntrophorhabdaceae bacterium]